MFEDSLPPRRRGFAIVYVCVTILAMVGFCSLVVDLARVQNAKRALEIACEAAARAGAGSISSDVSAVRSAAASAAVTSAGPIAVRIDPINNVVFLNWPSRTPLSGSARKSANAIQVSASC
jgi:hypothetical protein